MFRLIVDPPLDGATNMARDEALLILHARGETPPTLRLYQWSPRCLSLGRFQRSGEIDRARCKTEGVQVIRRPSGGRALLHDAELTYAVVTSENSALGGSIAASYCQISKGLLAGMERLGVAAELTNDTRSRGEGAKGRRGEKAQDSSFQSPAYQLSSQPSVLSPLQRTNSAACYDAPAAYEAVFDGRKLIGSAQRRQHGALLQHGAVPFTPHAERLCALLHRPPPDLAERMVTLSEALERHIDFEEVADAVIAGCAEAWQTTFEPGVWGEHELALAEELCAAYKDDMWTWGR